MPLLHVVIGSTRPGRVGAPVAEWFVEIARAHGGFDVEVIDLAEVALPMLEEPNHPRLRQYVHQYTKDWGATVERADAFVIVTPEYNYGYPASVKNALDHVYNEWAYAPVGFVSYGGIGAGTRSVQQLKQVVTTLRMVPVFESVNIPFVGTLVQDGKLSASDGMATAARDMLTELQRVESALHALRRSSVSAAD
ncbi:MAG: NAD(P)H-dependent oxidoreductase [Arachnia sp.]